MFYIRAKGWCTVGLRIAPVALFAVIITVGILTSAAFSQTPNQPMPPRHQWENMHDVSQIVCKEGLVLLEKANGSPACVSPNAYLRLVDRGWGMWNSDLMSDRPNMMQGIMGQVIRDPNLSQQLHSTIQQNQNLWYDVSPQLKQKLQQNPQLLQNMMMPIMDDPKLRQQMIETMQQHQQMMQSVQNNNMMMGMIQGNVPVPSNQTKMGGPMMGQQGHMGGPMMGKNMMHQNMMGQMTSQGMMMHNPQMMNSMMNQMMNNPQTKNMMQNMMMQNPYHMQAMIDQGMIGPMVGPMMNDPQLQQQMLDMMMQHQGMMMDLRQNQQFMNSLNQP